MGLQRATAQGFGALEAWVISTRCCFPMGTKMKLACILFCSILIQILMSNNNICKSAPCLCVLTALQASCKSQLTAIKVQPARSSNKVFRPQRGCFDSSPSSHMASRSKGSHSLPTPPASQVHSHLSSVLRSPRSVPSVGTCHIILPQEVEVELQ